MNLSKYSVILFFLSSYLCFGQSENADTLQNYNLHFQQTVIAQGHPAFYAKYSGVNSLNPYSESATSLTTTLFLGARLWSGASIYLNPEVSGGAGVSGAIGLAGFSNGETYRIGNPKPTLYPARLFIRQIFNLSGELKEVNDQPNALKDYTQEENITVTLGKFGISDIFDNNSYSHDPRTQFMNWALMSAGAWDYPADTRGYTWGAVCEYNHFDWALRIAAVMVPKTANGLEFDPNINKAYGLAMEGERSYLINNHKGTTRFLLFFNKADMGSYSETINNPVYQMDITQTRNYSHTKYGFSINSEQEINDYSGVFFRLSWNDGHNETWAFTEIDRSISAGYVINGNPWKRDNDQAGLALVANGLSSDHRNYLADGGHGFMIGDGALNYSPETITELYYLTKVIDNIFVTGDYQFVLNPAYNADRGPVHLFAIRLHVEF
jgi:high affinity Mn2+ porin